MIDLLAKYDVPLDKLNADALIKLRGIYEAECKALKGEADKNDQVTGGWIKALGSAVESDESVVTALKSFKSAVRELMYQLVDADTNVVVPLVDALADIKSDAMNERDYWIQKIKRENMVSVPRDAEYDAKLAETEDLAKLIRLSFQFISSSLDLTDSAFTDKFPINAKVEKGVKTGEMLPDLSRLPQKRNAETTQGRNASQRFVQFAWQGEDIPLGTLVADIAHDYVSSIKDGLVVSGPDITKALKESGQDMFAKEGFSLIFPTGTLTGRDTREAKAD